MLNARLEHPKDLKRAIVALFELRAWACSGIHISVPPGNLKPSGITPMIVAGFSLTRTARPITLGELPYRSFQMPYPSRRTGRSRLVVTGQKSAAQHRRHMQHAKIPADGPLQVVNVGRIAAFAQYSFFIAGAL